MDTIQKIRTKYLDERGDSSFNKFNTNDYTRFLEKEIIDNHRKQSENVVLDGVSKSFTEKQIDEAYGKEDDGWNGSLTAPK